MTVLESIVDWMASHDDQWSAVAVERAEHAIADTVACMVAGSVEPVTQKVMAAHPVGDSGVATIIHCSKKASAFWAAMINGTAAHELEIDDNFYPALTHASAVLVPALLALGEENNASGMDLIDAYIVGLEMHAFLGRGMNQSHYFAGWHPTATLGCIGTAAGCARLLKLDKTQTMAAMSLAVSMASGNKAQFGSEAKPFQCGMSAANAVLAANLAKAGVQGNIDILENPQGLLALYGGPAPRGWNVALDKLGDTLALEEFGLSPKRHPCCGSAHNSLDCILDLLEMHQFGVNEIEHIDVLVGSVNKKNLRYDNPVDGFQARFSMEYNVALILLKGCIAQSDFTLDAVQRPEIRRLLSLTTLKGRDFKDEPANADERLPHVVTITLKDGQRFTAQRARAKGEIEDPFTDHERADKIQQCCKSLLSPTSYIALVKALNQIQQLVSVKSITQPLH